MRAPRGTRHLVMALALSIAAASAGARAEEVALATGPEGGSYAALGGVIHDLFRERTGGWVEVRPVASGGSVDNMRRLLAGRAQIAIVQSDVLWQAHRGLPPFGERAKGIAAAAVLYGEVVHVLARAGAGIAGIEDLRGKRVAVGVEGSGTAATAALLLDAHEVPMASIVAERLPAAAAGARLRAGEIDAMIHIAAAPSPAVAEALAGGAAVLVPALPRALERARAKNPFVSESTIRAATYPGLAADVPALGVDAMLVAREELRADLVFETLSLLHASRDRLAAALPVGAAVLPERAAADVPVPLHPGAMAHAHERGAIERPVRAKVGLYLLDIFAFDLKSGSYRADFYLWFKWRGRVDASNDEFKFEIMNGRVDSIDAPYVDKFGGWTYVVYRVQATMRGNFLLHKYPFDTQSVTIQIESAYGTVEEVVFEADEAEPPRGALPPGREGGGRVGYEPTLTISDWQVTGWSHRAVPHTYPSDFGDPMTPGEYPTYSAYIFELGLKRIIVPYLLKFSVPLAIIVLMAFVVFFIHPDEFEVQASIVVTALLSCVAFHITQADNLPEVGYLVVADKFFILAYAVIFLTLLEIVLENWFVHRGSYAAASKLDRISRVAFPIAFFGPIAYLLLASTT